ncbi:MAG: PhnD/SsuA/transferrin family substrate-binding protein [Gammaproteobacteria bacterium]|nr:PhnD/SsuA/transferrin family substrate-binding protein [Gammaproteobacteria bacterium]
MRYVSANKLLVLLCLILLVVTHYFLGFQQSLISPIQLRTELQQQASCTINNSNQSQFKIFMHSESAAKKLLPMFCQDRIIAKQYGLVTIRWGQNDTATIQAVGKGEVDLLLTKASIVNALSATETHGYQAIASYQDYQAFLIGFNEKPELSKQYLLDKTIALVNYPTSRSGHILPKLLFTELGLSLDKLDIIYTQSHQHSRQQLIAGEVDLIASYWSKEDNSDLSEDYKTPLHSEVDSTRWFLKLDKNNTVLKCQTQRLLKQFSNQQTSSYYKNINILNAEECDNE